MFDFIKNGARRFEQLNRPELGIALDEIDAKFKADWKEMPTRCHEKIAKPLQRALKDQRIQPILLATVEPAEKKDKKDFELVEFGDRPDGDELLHFVGLGDQVFMIGAYEHGHRRSELRLFPPISKRDFDLKALQKDGPKALYGKPRGELDQIRLHREGRDTTAIQFNDGKFHQDESYAWALWESVGSALRRGRTLALRQAGELDQVELELKGKGRDRALLDAKAGRGLGLAEVLPLLQAKVGQATGDGPPGGHDLLHLLSWKGRTVAVTRERGEPSRVRAFIRDRIGARRAWIELRFPPGVAVPTGGVAASITGDTLRLFGGVDKKAAALSSEWSFNLNEGAGDAYAHGSFKRGPELPSAMAWATAIATAQRTVLSGGLAGFYADKKAEGAAPVADKIRVAIEQARQRGVDWAPRRAPPESLIAAQVLAVDDAAFVGPGLSEDARGRVFFMDGKEGFIELPALPARVGGGQLHLDGNLLVYTGGFLPGEPMPASSAVYTLDLDQLDGWKHAGEVSLLAGSNRLIEQDGRLVVMGLTPKGRFTFVPGKKQEAAA